MLCCIPQKSKFFCCEKIQNTQVFGGECGKYLKEKKRSKATKKSRYVLLFWKISIPSPALLDLEIPVKMQIGNWWV